MVHKDLHRRIDQFFAPKGILSRYIPGFEARQGQVDMAHRVLDALSGEKIALIDAGTGIGKSLAYLIASLLWKEQTDKSIIISTNTISLQEQLFTKDVPLAQHISTKKRSFVIAKGKKNYICRRRLEEEMQAPSRDEKEHKDLLSLFDFSRTSTTGDRSTLSFFPSSAVWDKVCVDGDFCNPRMCPEVDHCFFIHARKAVNEADVIITNHSYLFTQVIADEKEDEDTLLTNASALIVDEAHHIEEKAIEYFAKTTSYRAIMKLSSQADPFRVASKVAAFKKYAHPENEEEKQFLANIDLDGPMRVRAVEKALQVFFTLFKQLVGQQNWSQRVSVLPAMMQQPAWQEIIVAKEGVYSALAELKALFDSLERKIAKSKDETLKNIRMDLLGLSGEVSRAQANLQAVFDERTTGVRWIEHDAHNGISVSISDIESGKIAKEAIREQLDSLVLCSATLMTKNTFSFVKNSLGIAADDAETMEHAFASPFQYKTQALLGCPIDLPLPDDARFSEQAASVLLDLLEASRGNAFILFTSYTALEDMYMRLEEPLKAKKFTLLKHGSDHRSELLRRFKTESKPVLFGTDSFWEGVDVVGDALRLVVIMKLPFQVPSDPIVEAKSRYMKNRGEDSFSDFSVPKAIIKFKQAFGRLIRHREDRGAVVCLDTRLVKKRYGADFIQSLPECTMSLVSCEEMLRDVRAFYKETKKETVTVFQKVSEPTPQKQKRAPKNKTIDYSF